MSGLTVVELFVEQSVELLLKAFLVPVSKRHRAIGSGSGTLVTNKTSAITSFTVLLFLIDKPNVETTEDVVMEKLYT